MMKPKAPRLVTVAILTTITIIFWVFFDVYRILTAPSKIDIDPKLLEPFDPSLDLDSLDKLENRLFFEEGETSEFPLEKTPTITPPTTPTSTLSGQLSGYLPIDKQSGNSLLLICTFFS